MGKNIRFIAFGFLLLITGLLSWPNIERPAFRGLLDGSWTAGFETAFTKNSIFYEVSRKFWGDIEYNLFGQGRPGVIVGKNGWLFSSEEFQTSRDSKKFYQQHISYINGVISYLKNKDIQVLIALVPAKARLHADNFPESKKAVLDNSMRDMHAQIVNLGSALGGDGFLKTDTHWSPEGARSSARMIARVIGRAGGEQKYTNIRQSEVEYRGDLLRYIPVSHELPQDHIATYELKGTQTDLFGDEDIEVVLAGTSYSKKPEFNFENFLKEYLNRDVLNMADEGKGPFETMKSYLKSNTFIKTPPKIIIWEIPERYLTLP